MGAFPLSALDRLLGRGVVTVGPEASFEIDDAALAALRHVARPPAGERCWCPECRLAREHDVLEQLVDGETAGRILSLIPRTERLRA